MPQRVIDWPAARQDWETGMSNAGVARKYEVSPTAVREHRRKEGWSRDGESVSTPSSVDVAEFVGAFGDDTVDLSDHPMMSEAERIAKLEAEVARLEAEAAAESNDIELRLPDTAEGVESFFTHEYMAELAVDKLNETRMSKGFQPIEMAYDDPKVLSEIKKLAKEFLARQTKFAGETNARALKMAIADDRYPWGYRLMPIPAEPTVNRTSDNPIASVKRYQMKGFKLITPVLCVRSPCWGRAPVKDGKFQWGPGPFHSEEHLLQDDHAKQRVREGVTSTADRNAPAVNMGMVGL